MERIYGYQPSNWDLAKRVLTWISHTRRPLTTGELRYALAVELGEPGIDEDNLPEVNDMVSFCEGLIIVDKESDIIGLVHYTTQEYLDRVSQTWIPDAHKDIALVCLGYLSFQEFSACSCLNDKEFEDRLERNALLDYCAKNWGDHVRDADDKGADEAALRFLEDEKKLASAVQVRMVSEYRFTGYCRKVPARIAAAHVTAQFGLSRIMTRLLADGSKADEDDNFSRTPLSYAAEYGHLNIVQLLAPRQDTNLDSVDQDGRTPLSWAAGCGHVDIVNLLLDHPRGVGPNCKDHRPQTPLSWAARKGCVGVVKCLIARGDVDKESRDRSGQTPLSWAAYNGHLEVVKMLAAAAAAPQVDVDSKDDFSQTPLSWAARNGHLGVVSFLVDMPGVDADSRDDGDCTALMWASAHGHVEVVKLLASRPDVDCDRKDRSGQSSLSWAARKGHLDIVKFLMARDDVHLQSTDRRGLTALRWAAWNGYEDVVTVLAAGRQHKVAKEEIKPTGGVGDGGPVKELEI